MAILIAGTWPLAGIAPVQSTGPFGLAMGMRKGEVEKIAGPLKLAGQTPNVFETAKVPRPLGDFENYLLEILPTSGLCAIRGIGVNIKTSSHGIEVMAGFKRLAGLVEAAYGKYGQADFLRTGSIWDEPEDWTMALLRQERVLQAAWDRDEGSTMKNNVSEILLNAHALNRETAYMILQYKFDNREACEAEKKAFSSGAL
jgi:hypothetical protein